MKADCPRQSSPILTYESDSDLSIIDIIDMSLLGFGGILAITFACIVLP